MTAQKKEELLAFRERMTRFNEWERANRPEPLSAEEGLHLASILYELLPIGARLDNDDPEYEGVRLMWQRLAALSGD